MPKTCQTSDAAIAVGYVRVSTAEQAREGVSLDAQRARIEAHCAAAGLRLARIEADEGISGRRRANRPGLEAALSAVCGDRGVLVCYSLSRLARSTKDAIEIAERIQRAGARLVMLAEQVDTSTAAGRMFYTLLSAISQFESDLISERTKMAIGHKRQLGQRYCKVPPYGFRFAGGALTANPEEQAILDRMRSLRGRRVTIQVIADRLTREGVRNRAGQPFPHQQISRLLRRLRLPDPSPAIRSEQAHSVQEDST